MRKGNFFYQQQKESFMSKETTNNHNYECNDEFSFSEQENILIEEAPVFVHQFNTSNIINKELILE